MSTLSESGSLKWGLYCEPCDYLHFSTYNEWQVHHLRHLRQPFVRLVKLNSSLSAKLLQGKSYQVNTGVARSSQHHVPPLKISLIKEQGIHKFAVKRKISRASNSSNPDDRIGPESGGLKDEAKVKEVQRGLSDVEGKDLLERLGANFSISRRSKATPATASGDGPPPVADIKKENILERLSGIGGISVSAVSKSQNAESKPLPGVSISSKAKPIELKQLKKLKNQVLENDKKVFDENKILEKLSGSGLISIAPKAVVKDEGSDFREGTPKRGEGEEGPPKADLLERLGLTSNRSSKSEDSNDSSDSKMSGGSRTSQVNASEENGKTAGENSGVEQKKFVRVKQSSFSKKSMQVERQGSQEEASEEKAGQEDGKEKANHPEERGIDILERLTENLNNTVGIEQSAECPNSSECNSTASEDPLATVGEMENVNHEPNASESECPEPPQEMHFPAAGERSTQEREQVQPMLLTPSSSSGQEGESSKYSAMGQGQQEPYEESNSVSGENNDANENPVSFTSLSNEDQSEGQGEQQTAFWSDIQSSSNSVDQPQEDPLLTPENSVPNGDANFLHNFSNDYQSAGNNLQAENSEFMSLDRLGQTQHQHQHPPYGPEPTSPMEHLSQQVQRIPNPTPQINVISQHHLQAPPPPPPQLHTGVPLSPQHISPQQANSYDAMHLQPPLPPPLYQGYMYNQNYPPQPQMQRPAQPQMPMLQQRPHIPSRAFQPMPVPQQRPRPRPVVKRSHIRPPQDMMPTKQPRMSSMQVRPQVPSPASKLPSGITITPPKKALEANKVANVLASRGITVTPSRQSSQGMKQPQQPQQQQQQQRTQSSSSVLNISSAVSITANHNRSSGGFAVPGPRRSAPIVNHQAERPERCMTVDLTQDDEMPHSQARNRSTARFACNVCGKMFASASALATHKAHHRNIFPFKCDLCAAEYNNMTQLMNHRQVCQKKAQQPDLAIPIVDLNHPGAREELRKCGIHNFIPLAQLQTNSSGYFGVPIIHIDASKERAVSNLSLLGAGNILVLGKMKTLTSQSGH